MSESMRYVREGKGAKHESFVVIERMSEADIQSYASEPLLINYCFADSPFGELLIGSTSKGVCYLGFLTGSREDSLETLKSEYPHSLLYEKTDEFQIAALTVLKEGVIPGRVIALHLCGTDFQMRAWQALLKLPAGSLTTYGDIANYLGCPGASRAVGTAIGHNSVAFLIPCHRVIRATGGLGGFRWGLPCKTRMIEWEEQGLLRLSAF